MLFMAERSDRIRRVLLFENADHVAPVAESGRSRLAFFGPHRNDACCRVFAVLLLAGALTACAGQSAPPAESTENVPTSPPTAESPAHGAAAAGPGAPRRSQELVVVSRSDDELYILELRLNDIVLNEGLIGYVDNSTLFLPLGQLADSLEFPISVDPSNGQANGWFLSENRLFSLDVRWGEVVVEGRRGRYDPRSVEVHADDIYVDSRLLSRWFPVDLRFDLSNSIVQAESREALPIEARLAREELRARLAGQRGAERPAHGELDTPYRWFDWPFVDFSMEGGYSNDPDTGETWVGRYNALFTADLLKMSANVFLAGDDNDGLSQARLRLGRTDPQGELLGPLHATEFSFGDINSPKTTLVSNSRFGRGAEISSFPIGRDGEFSRTNLIGDLPLGWDVELYRNEVLIDFQSARADGRYEFIDVPLVYGVNVLRLEFFGPQGQRRTDVRRVLVDAGQVPKGKFNFRLAATQHDTGLFDVDDNDVVTAESQLDGEGRYFAQLEYGLTRHVGLAVGASSIPLLSGRRTYGTAGLRLGLGNTFSELDIVRDDEGGTAGKLGMQIVLPANLSLLLEHSEFRDFISEDADDVNGLLERRSNLRLDGVLSPPILPRIPFSVTARHENRAGDYRETEISNRLSMGIRMIALSNSYTWLNVDNAGVETETANGSLLVGGRFGRANIRGEVRYDVEPESRVAASGLTGDWYFGTDMSARLSVQRQFIAPTRTVYGAGISRKFRHASVGLTAEYGSDDSASALLTISFGLGRDPRTGAWFASARPVAEQGAVSARAFLDHNLSGVYDEGDEPVEGARLESSSGMSRGVTDENGLVFIASLPAHERVDVTLPARGLVDPYWVAQPEGYTMTPRPGRAAVAEFPVVTTGEVDGTVYLVRDGLRKEVSEVVLQLLHEEGKVVQEVETAYDGFYLFESILPGRYSVRVSPEQLERLDLSSSQPIAVRIGGDGTVVSGVEFTLYAGEPIPDAIIFESQN